MANRAGEQFGNYRLIRKIGSGGTAEVYLGEHIHFPKMKAAVKILKDEIEEEKVERNFLHEVKIHAALNHPHIVRIMDFGVQDRFPYIIMEFAGHGNLHNMQIDAKPVPYDIIISYVKPIAEAIQYAHSLHIAHCDLKPKNIFLGKNHTILIGDFGYARILESTSQLLSHSIKGTWEYTAPEQWTNAACEASDQYALGVIVYQWLCGSVPFSGNTQALAYQHLQQNPPSLQKKSPPHSQAIEEVVFKALSKDPKDRFTNIQIFADELEKSLRATMTATSPWLQTKSYQQSQTPLTEKSQQPEKSPLISNWPSLPLPFDQKSHNIDKSDKKSIVQNSVNETISVLNNQPVESLENELEGIPQQVTTRVAPTNGLLSASASSQMKKTMTTPSLSLTSKQPVPSPTKSVLSYSSRSVKSKKGMAQLWTIGIGIAIFLGTAFICPAYSIRALQDNYAFYGRAIKSTQATVLNVSRSTSIDGDGNSSVTCDTTLQYQPEKLLTTTFHNQECLTKGQHAQVLYNPYNQNDVKTASQASSDLANNWAGFSFFAFIMIFTIIIITFMINSEFS